MYCSHCGNQLAEPETDAAAVADAAAAAAEGQVGAAAEIGSAEVEIEKIRADKEIKLARIAAKMGDADNETELAATEVLAETVAATDPEPEPEPVVMTDPGPEPEPEEEPPPVVEASPAEPGKKEHAFWKGF